MEAPVYIEGIQTLHASFDLNDDSRQGYSPIVVKTISRSIDTITVMYLNELRPDLEIYVDRAKR
jgi:hypothetical protein